MLAPVYGPGLFLYGFFIGSAFVSLVLVGIFAYFYAKSDFQLARHLQQMLDEKEAALKETYLTHANLEEKYAFAYTLTLIQQFLLEEMDETNLLTRITDIIQGSRAVIAVPSSVWTRTIPSGSRLHPGNNSRRTSPSLSSGRTVWWR